MADFSRYAGKVSHQLKLIGAENQKSDQYQLT
jgi:hypothetical protein